MKKLRDTAFFHEAIHELNYPFGTFYLFESFILGEINEDELLTWEEHGVRVTEELANLYENNGKDFVYISNRINSYSVMPADWIKFFNYGYTIKGYAIVSYTKMGYLNALLEKFFVRAPFKRFSSLENAIAWAKELSNVKTIAS